jgi:LEA14-like dessication related protein
MKTKLPLIVGITAGLVTLIGTSFVAYKWLSKQVTNLQNYSTRISKVVVRKISLNEVSFDIFMFFKNNSDLTVTLAEQVYEVYANDIYITQFVNKAPNTLKAREESEIGMRITLDPAYLVSKIGVNAATLIQDPKKVKIKILMKYKVSVLGIKVQIPPIPWEDSLAYFLGMK